jgi:hypothetical protein
MRNILKIFFKVLILLFWVYDNVLCTDHIFISLRLHNVCRLAIMTMCLLVSRKNNCSSVICNSNDEHIRSWQVIIKEED